MDICEVLAGLGGVARTEQLLRHVPADRLARAVAAGEIERLTRGGYGLASAPAAHRAAQALHGTICCLSAAVEHGWEVLRPPDRPWVSVPAGRNVALHRRRGVHFVRSGADGSCTSPVPTVLECARRLPLVEALAVADSAARRGVVVPDELRAAAAVLRGPGAGHARLVAAHVSPLAANPLESALRALSLDVPGLRLRPQERVDVDGITIHPDLVDSRLRVVVEAEGWLCHGQPEQFARDLWRYTALTVDRWIVVRFGHEHVTRQPVWVTSCLASLARTTSSRLDCRSCA